MAHIKRIDEMNNYGDMSIYGKVSDMDIANKIGWEYTKHYDPNMSKECWAEQAAIDMAGIKDEQMWNLIDLLLDAIDHAYLQTSGKRYGSLALEVADKVEYLKNLRTEYIKRH